MIRQMLIGMAIGCALVAGSWVLSAALVLLGWVS